MIHVIFMRMITISVMIFNLTFYVYCSQHLTNKLFDAVKRDDVERDGVKSVMDLLKQGADINGREVTTNKTALMYANSATVVSTLLAHWPGVNLQDQFGRTALIYRVMQNNKDAVDLLLDAHADPNVRDNHGVSPLHYGARHAGVPVVATLLGAHADHWYVDRANRSVLEYASFRGNESMVQYLQDFMRTSALNNRKKSINKK